jgi:UDP-N-acetylmuramyl pentapeptide phosphotransferase/UDP-N-acetylglucosamine-1-phosphate transferase/tetratricopeptide (TPR) repeat protein
VLSERLLAGLLLSTLVAYAATPIAIGVANRLQFFDLPRGYKAHGRPTPYLGGAAVMAGFAMAVLLTAGHWSKTAPLLGGGALLWVVGTVDDRRTVSPALRVLVELVLAWLTWKAGLGWHLHMGAAVDLAMTCVWVVGVINAFNLFDNMDGAASTMALAVSAGAALLGVVRGDAWLAVGAASLGGACLGFLPRNLSFPARIFLGDGGSMPVGFVAAVLVMVAASTSVSAWQSLPVALLLVGLPTLDTTLVIVSRRRRGVPVLAGGKDHLTHRARRYMPSARSVALTLGGAQAVVSVVGVLAAEGGSSFVVVAAIVYTMAGLGAIVVLEGRGSDGLEDRSPMEGHSPVEDRCLAETSGDTSVPPRVATPGHRDAPGARRAHGRDGSPLGLAALAALGLGAGVSPFFFSYYDTGVWEPIGLGLVLLCAVAIVARPSVPRAPAAMAIAGLLGLGLWSLFSTAWTESVEGATVAGNRLLVYGTLLVLLIVLVRSQRRAALTLGAAGVGVAIVAVSVLGRLLGHDPGALFLGGRLNEPLGYINGEGCLFAMGFWLCTALVESRRALLAGPAMALATLMASLALLSQSRGTALAMLIALACVLALLPGRVRRAYALALVATCTALAGPALLHVYRSAAGGAVSLQAGHEAGRAALLASLGAGLAWGLATGAWEAARKRGLSLSPARMAGAWALLLPTLAALVVAAASAHTIEREVSTQWHAFTHLGKMTAAVAPASHDAASSGGDSSESSSESRTRLLSGAGNRYDYWRIAWDLWKEHPLAGVGAGGYASFYYQRRATTEDIQQSHSIELEVLSELGLVGGALLAAFFGAVAWGVLRMRRHARSSALARASAVAATGSFAAWAAQTSVDWMHLLPGLTAIALIAVAALVWPRTGAGARGRARVVAGCALLATLVVAGGSVSRQALSQIYAERARNELATNPAAAAADADRSLQIDSDAVETYYVKAAALARFNQAGAAEAALRQALGHESRNFVTWALLGDIAVREGHVTIAERYYRRAHVLNPRNVTLTALAANPAAALH